MRIMEGYEVFFQGWVWLLLRAFFQGWADLRRHGDDGGA
jgi:hypothetical protein